MLNRISNRVLHRKLTEDGGTLSHPNSSPNSPLKQPPLRTGVGLDITPKIDASCSLPVDDKCSCGSPRIEIRRGSSGCNPRTTDSPKRRRAGETSVRLDEELERRNSCGNATNDYTKRSGNTVTSSLTMTSCDLKKTTSAGEVVTPGSVEKYTVEDLDETYTTSDLGSKNDVKSQKKSGEDVKNGEKSGPTFTTFKGGKKNDNKKRSSTCSDYTPLNFDVNYVKVSPPKMTRRLKRESPPKQDEEEEGFFGRGTKREMMIRLGKSPPCHPNSDEEIEAKIEIPVKKGAKNDTKCEGKMKISSSEESCEGASFGSATESKPASGGESSSPLTSSSLESSGSEADFMSRSATDYICWDDVRTQLTDEISDNSGRAELGGCDPQRLISLINSANVTDEKLNDSITLVKDGDNSLLQFVFTLRLDKDSLKAVEHQKGVLEKVDVKKKGLAGVLKDFDVVDGSSTQITGRVNLVKEDGVTQIGSLNLQKPLLAGKGGQHPQEKKEAPQKDSATERSSNKDGKDDGAKTKKEQNKNKDLKVDIHLAQVSSGSKKKSLETLNQKLQQSEMQQTKNIYSPTKKKNSENEKGDLKQETWKKSVESQLPGDDDSVKSSSLQVHMNLVNTRKNMESCQTVLLPEKLKKPVTFGQSPDEIICDIEEVRNSISGAPRGILIKDGQYKKAHDDDLGFDDIRPEEELTHMSWEEVMKEARSLGIPLNRNVASSGATLPRKPGRVQREEVRSEVADSHRRCSVISVQDDLILPMKKDGRDDKMATSWACPSCLSPTLTPSDKPVEPPPSPERASNSFRRWGSPLKEKLQSFFCRRAKPKEDTRITDQTRRQQARPQCQTTWCSTAPCRQAHRSSSCKAADRMACNKTCTSPRKQGGSMTQSRGNRVMTSSPVTCRCQTSCHHCSCEALLSSPKRGYTGACSGCKTSPTHPKGGTTSWTSPNRGGGGTECCRECTQPRMKSGEPMSPTKQGLDKQGCIVLDMTSPTSRNRGTSRGPAPQAGCGRGRSHTPDFDWVDSAPSHNNPGGSLSPRKTNPVVHRSTSTRTSTRIESGTGTHTNTDTRTKANMLKSLAELQECSWYWGTAGFDEAEGALEGREDGSFLVRDSSDPRYLLSLSFRSLQATHHTRIEHYKGKFSFYSQQGCHEATSIVEFIEGAMRQSREGKCLYYLRPRALGLNPAPVLLLHPISKN